MTAITPISSAARSISALVCLGMSLTAMVNSMPSVWIIPKFGPLPAEYLRSGMFLAAVVVVLCGVGFTLQTFGGKLRLPVFVAVLLDLALLGMSVWVSYEFAVVNIEIQDGLFFFDDYHGWVTLAAVVVMLILCWRVWGVPLAVFGLISTLYYFSGQWWPGLLKIIPRSFVDSFPEDMLFNLGSGMLGFLFESVIYTVFPFIIFGALLEATGVGDSLIRLAFRLTKGTRGGPAHAAVLASSLFGTMSGVAVANVVGTGVMTIPMIKKRGFSPHFSGGIEATASTGGQIVPPIMGAAALIMADQLGVSYLVVIMAALLPAFFYYLSLFFNVIFEARRMNIQTGTLDVDTSLSRDDYTKLFVLLGAIVVIVWTLLYGLSAAAAGVFVVLYMVVACFLTREIRQHPWKVVKGFINGGDQFGRLLIALGVVGIVLGVLSGTGLPVKLAILVDSVMQHSLLMALIVTGVAALVFGMGMPTLPAYLTIILILGPSLTKLGMSLLVAHMFVFYFGVASAITPPVCIAAYAAASIAGAGPLHTGFTAFRIGLALFIVPFAFAYNPELLLVDEAGGYELLPLLSICARLALALWLLNSALSRYDATPLKPPEALLRFGLTAALLVIWPSVHWTAFVIALVLIGFNQFRSRQVVVATA